MLVTLCLICQKACQRYFNPVLLLNKHEENAGNEYALSHPNLHTARPCLENVCPCMFWTVADIYPDLVARQHVQVRLMSNFSMKGGIPQLAETDGALCFICREDNKTLCHFFFDCPTFNPKRMAT